MSKPELISLNTIQRAHPTIKGQQQEIPPGVRFTANDAEEQAFLLGAKAAKLYAPASEAPPSIDEPVVVTGSKTKAPTKAELAAAAKAAEAEEAERLAAAQKEADEAAGKTDASAGLA